LRQGRSQATQNENAIKQLRGIDEAFTRFEAEEFGKAQVEREQILQITRTEWRYRS